MRMLTWVLVVSVGGLANHPAGAQGRNQVFVHVVNQAGQAVTNLALDEFVVKEGELYCGIMSAERSTEPMRIALLVDNSDRIDKASALTSLREGVDTFLTTLAPPHEIGLFTIGGNIQWRVDFTTDRALLRQSAGEIFTDVGTAPVMVDAVRETWERRFGADEPWPVFVLVVTDGSEASSSMNENQYNEFVSELISGGATIHTVLLSSRGGSMVTNYAINLTRNTAGIYTPLASATRLPGTLSELAMLMNDHYDEVSERYEIVFECPESSGARVQAGVSRQGAIV
jgi:hypothetical protein